jgi:hypothetical protein
VNPPESLNEPWKLQQVFSCWCRFALITLPPSTAYSVDESPWQYLEFSVPSIPPVLLYHLICVSECIVQTFLESLTSKSPPLHVIPVIILSTFQDFWAAHFYSQLQVRICISEGLCDPRLGPKESNNPLGFHPVIPRGIDYHLEQPLYSLLQEGVVR